MKIIKTILISCMLAGAATTVSAVNPSTGTYNQNPAKTICIKNPAASNADQFFSSTSVLMFEVYKAGSADDMSKIIKVLNSDPNVESVTEGPLTGDFQALTISLKSTKNKAWFVALFKKAGLNHIKINNNAAVEIDKI